MYAYHIMYIITHRAGVQQVQGLTIAYLDGVYNPSIYNTPVNTAEPPNPHYYTKVRVYVHLCTSTCGCYQRTCRCYQRTCGRNHPPSHDMYTQAPSYCTTVHLDINSTPRYHT